MKNQVWDFSGQSTCFYYAIQYSSESPEFRNKITLNRKAEFYSEKKGQEGNILPAAGSKTKHFLDTRSQKRMPKELTAVNIFFL